MIEAKTPNPGRNVLAGGEGMTSEMYRLFCVFVTIEAGLERAASQSANDMQRTLRSLLTTTRNGIEETKRTVAA